MTKPEATQQDTTQAGSRCTALAVTWTDHAERRPLPRGHDGRAHAGFVTHLLATRAGVPEHRAKRRAAPEMGAAAYGRMAGLSGPSGPVAGFAREA
jgi:hypothetical protein